MWGFRRKGYGPTPDGDLGLESGKTTHDEHGDMDCLDVNSDGLDASSLRRDGLSPYDRRCRKTFACILVMAAAGGSVAGVVLANRRNDVAGSKVGYLKLVPPPLDLSRKCSPLAVSTAVGWDTCERTCAAADCCFLSEGHWFSCAKGNEESCSAYDYACQTLQYVENLHKEADKDKDRDPDG